ncbi:MAG: pyridoxamine 5'-phosphate oxidase family protein [Fibrobacteres bacterium]|nr:pyridoxamine 5'-phosphate oxidase family protein [Fibrobacterota bacterium]
MLSFLQELDLRRSDRQITDNEAIDIINNGEYGILSLVASDNNGYGIPLSYAFSNNTLYFHCAGEGSKLDYIRRNNKVSFCVVGKTEVLPAKFSTKYESAIITGLAIEIQGEEKREALTLLIKKYSPDFMNEGIEYINRAFDKTTVVKIIPESITGKARR